MSVLYIDTTNCLENIYENIYKINIPTNNDNIILDNNDTTIMTNDTINGTNIETLLKLRQKEKENQLFIDTYNITEDITNEIMNDVDNNIF